MSLRASIVPIAILAAACSGRFTGGMGEERVEITTSNRLSLNRLSLNRLSLNALSTRALESGAGALAQTEDGRELLTYVARCALNVDQSLVVDGAAYPGLIGLAPEWFDGACADTCQRWISACLLAHVNAKGVSVPISLRGPTALLGLVTGTEQRAYPVEEAGFYGNVFTGSDDLEMYACLGRGLEGESDSRYLDDRLCASTDQCGFTHTGSCAPPPGATYDPLQATSACVDGATPQTGYVACTVAPGRVDNLWFEIITVYLKQ